MNKEVRHLARAGILLALIVAGVFVARQVTKPDSFGQYGNYRGANVAEWASEELVFGNTAQCAACHSSNLSQWSQSKHASVSCENCHGPGVAHIEKAALMLVDRSSSLCLVCHETLLSRPRDFPQVNGAQHSAGLLCIACHNPHNPTISTVAPATPESTPIPATGASGPPLIPHDVEGRSACLLCHESGAAGATVIPANHVGRTNETCQLCHKGAIP